MASARSGAASSSTCSAASRSSSRPGRTTRTVPRSSSRRPGGAPSPAPTTTSHMHAAEALRRRPFAVALALVLLGALVLRLWGLRTGLPYVYNVDEGAHFVPRAIGMFDHSYDPGYFINPPAMTYLYHGLFWLRWGGDDVRHAFATDPGAVWTFACAASAVLATAGIGVLAWAAVRLFDRRVA